MDTGQASPQRQHANHYATVAAAINYIQHHFKDQPSLDDIAAAVSLSPYHLQRVFSEWAGVSPKKFVQYLSVEHAKKRLKEQHAPLMDVALDTGLSGTGRLHDLFVNIEAMTPGEYKNGGQSLTINYQRNDTLFGSVIIASTLKGVCYIAFEDGNTQAMEKLKAAFPNAIFREAADQFQHAALNSLNQNWSKRNSLNLHLRGTDFQLKVWQSLINIPLGQLTTYGTIAATLQKPKAARAVGTAIGSNPIALLIPCHRVIQANGTFGGYMWGTTRKSAIIGWEAAQKKPGSQISKP